MDDYRRQLNDLSSFEQLIRETKRLYQEYAEKNINEIYLRLFKRLIWSVSTEINFTEAIDREFVLNVFDDVFENNHPSIRKNLETERYSFFFRNGNSESLEKYANSLFNCLKMDKDERLKILRKFSTAFQTHLKPI